MELVSRLNSLSTLVGLASYTPSPLIVSSGADPGGPAEFSSKQGGEGSNHLLGAICIGNILKKGGGGGPFASVLSLHATK